MSDRRPHRASYARRNSGRSACQRTNAQTTPSRLWRQSLGSDWPKCEETMCASRPRSRSGRPRPRRSSSRVGRSRVRSSSQRVWLHGRSLSARRRGGQRLGGRGSVTGTSKARHDQGLRSERPRFALSLDRDREVARGERAHTRVAAAQEESLAGQLRVSASGTGGHERRIESVVLLARGERRTRNRHRTL